MRAGILFSVFTLFLIIGDVTAQSNPDSSKVNNKRLTLVVAGGSSVYFGGMTGLYFLWYDGYPQSSFHFFNDNDEWLQMDKMGHLASGYYLSKWGYQALSWAGVNNKKATWYGAGYGMLFLTTIEVFDGFSSEWGFSKGDFVADIAGCGIMTAQQLIWKEQRIDLKFSYHPTSFPEYNPELLGSSPIQSIFKDYNGQTYWLSGNIKSFLRKDSKFPKWLNVAFGYGADGMIGATSNPTEIDGEPIPTYTRYRQFYFAPDIDLTRIRTRSKLVNTVFDMIGFIKFPLPTLEYNSTGKFIFHPFYF